jgi:hypothetical protein
MAFNAAFENGSAARSFAADAYDCIMARPRRTCRIQGCGALRCARLRAPLGSLVRPQPDRQQRAAVLAAVKDKPFGWPPERPSLTAAARDGQADMRSGRKNARGAGRTKECRTKEDENELTTLTKEAPYKACSGFTRVTARRIARPPKVTFVARLRPDQSPDRVARQLPDLSTIVRVRSSLTDDSRRQGALPGTDSFAAADARLRYELLPQGFRHGLGSVASTKLSLSIF